MKPKRRIYSEEFRKEALRLRESSGKSVTEIERELGITAGLLYKWQVRYGQATIEREASQAKPTVQTLEAEIRRLKRDNAILQQEREILKKAVKLFSQELS